MTNDIASSSLSSNYSPQNYRSADVFGGNFPIQTPSGELIYCSLVFILSLSYNKQISLIFVGIVHSTQPNLSPPLPPRPHMMFQSPQTYSPFNSGFAGGYGSPFGNNFGSYGSSFGAMGMGGMGYNSFGGGYRQGIGANPLDPETRFIQIAEESSRSAFQSIEQVVSTIGNIATMLDSTYFALTSSFRAILGLAANFSQMRGFLTRFFSTFTIFRSVIWLYKKLMFMAGLSKTNPATVINLNEAFKDAEKVNSGDFFNTPAQQSSTGLPMVLFLAFVFSAPYLIMKLFGSLANSTADQSEFIDLCLSNVYKHFPSNSSKSISMAERGRCHSHLQLQR